jgi:hypothetical protein
VGIDPKKTHLASVGVVAVAADADVSLGVAEDGAEADGVIAADGDADAANGRCYKTIFFVTDAKVRYARTFSLS